MFHFIIACIMLPINTIRMVREMCEWADCER